jgi:hypothetical protein
LRALTLGISCATLLGCVQGFPSQAADFDGGKNLRCFVGEIQECEQALGCAGVTAADADIPVFVVVDFKAKKLSGTTPEGRSAESPIQRVAKDGGVVAIQGMENGRAWSARIDAAGALTAVVADRKGAFVLYGACLPL